MKINKFAFYTLPLLLILLITSCKSDDDDGNGSETETFQNSCCKIPPQSGPIGIGKVYIPNAFTPNGDGINDIFYVFSDEEISRVESMKIFNENGDIIFERNNSLPNSPNAGWNGVHIDGVIDDGVFPYEVVVSDIDEVTEIITGIVCCRFSSQPMPCVDFEEDCTYGIQHDGDGGLAPSISSEENCE